MSFGIVATLGSAAIGAIGTMSAAKSASASAKDQAKAAAGASAADLALAREQRQQNELLFSQYLADENMAKAYADALAYGTATYTPGTGGLGQGTLSEAELRTQYPALWTQYQALGHDGIDGNAANAAAAGGFPTFVSQQMGPEAVRRIDGSAPPPITITRDQVMAQIEGTPLAQLANTDYAAREGLADQTYAGARDLAQDEYGDLTGVAHDNLDQRLSLEDASYAAWLPQSQEAEQRAIDLNFSRGGVTGLVGETRRGVGQTTQEAALERNRRYLEGRQTAYEPYYGEMTDATALRGQRNQGAYDAYSHTRGANYDQFSGDRLNSYANYTDFLAERQNKGFDARSQISSGGQAYVTAASNANNRAADAAAASYGRQGQIQQQLYGDLANIAGNVYGAITNRKKTG